LACAKVTNKYIITLKINRMEHFTTQEKEFLFIAVMDAEKSEFLSDKQRNILSDIKIKLSNII
tara:strand:- start:271 stop:459 length:189 start_codon:yes stop_codon:yes gene_type:complete